MQIRDKNSPVFGVRLRIRMARGLCARAREENEGMAIGELAGVGGGAARREGPDIAAVGPVAVMAPEAGHAVVDHVVGALHPGQMAEREGVNHAGGGVQLAGRAGNRGAGP